MGIVYFSGTNREYTDLKVARYVVELIYKMLYQVSNDYSISLTYNASNWELACFYKKCLLKFIKSNYHIWFKKQCLNIT